MKSLSVILKFLAALKKIGINLKDVRLAVRFDPDSTEDELYVTVSYGDAEIFSESLNLW